MLGARNLAVRTAIAAVRCVKLPSRERTMQTIVRACARSGHSPRERPDRMLSRR